MRIRVPGPSVVLGGAVAAADALETALGLVPRAAEALTRVEALLDRAEKVADRAEKVADRADQVVSHVDETTKRAHAVLATAELVTRDAGRTVDGATGVLDRVDTSLVVWEPSLRKLAPSLERFAEALSPAEVTAAISLVDRMPLVLDHLENDVLPMLSTLERVGPDVHELLEVADDLRRVITGLPGIGLLRRRGENEPPPVEGSVHEGTADTTEASRRTESTS
jgi:ABC-type transporter Mla subunit MlaD